eukprot:CAMPEP_0119111850 /NCGR_PEP_ID=MMETSP1180-20130426/37576_1 /TAXON_ID=3052 ORGANISM="Chlamydomonas cf sp, Strain CCMP681" /NCGR_SAMPLE_ID=MMETSP1180 /ASSEMBLY_ACC=CAM_ASM_000741 /LENGTH=65 /DNA_ID=CAMNT_0007099069 /DNA_START=768 /DNA_END=965 /DNA_ORIENTATION=+
MQPALSNHSFRLVSTFFNSSSRQPSVPKAPATNPAMFAVWSTKVVAPMKMLSSNTMTSMTHDRTW